MSGKRYAVLIGNASFPGENPGDVPRLPPLHCPAADVAGLRQILEADSHGGYIVTPLIDRPHSEARRAVYDRLKQAGPEDQVVIYYSGHGKLDPGGNLYLAGRDTDPESLDPTAFAAADIQKYVAESRRRHGSLFLIAALVVRWTGPSFVAPAKATSRIRPSRRFAGWMAEGSFI
jgi:hypothetical protein